jgi:hypothetical protein
VETDRAPLASIAQVRGELRRLGYLDSGLDRFVLGGAASSPLWAAASVALRVGVAGGVVFGIALTLLAASLEPRQFARAGDVLVLAAYLFVFVGLAAAAASLLGALLAAWAGRRLGRRPGPHLSRNVGLTLAIAGLAYLSLWWRSHAAEASPAALVVFVFVGLALTGILARFGSLAAIAVLSAGGLSDHLPEASLSRRHMLPLLAGAAALFAGGVAAATYLSPGEPPAPEFAVVPTGLRVRVLGIDGLERRMAEQMLARGEMPRLAGLVAAGAHAALAAEPERVPAIVWTTIAAGRGPESHGVRSADTRRLVGMSAPVPFAHSDNVFTRSLARATDLIRITRTTPATSVLRAVKTFWNVASEKGLRVGVVNWWASWPAEPLNGYGVTARAFFKLEKGLPPDRDVHPPELLERLRPLVAATGEERPRALDLFHVSAARLLSGDAPPDLEAVYLSGLDIATEQRLGRPAPDIAALDAEIEDVRDYHRFVDRLIGEFAAGLQPQDVLVLVGDPGRLPRRSAEPGQGLLLLSGGPIRQVELGPVSERDVAPTVLHLLGLPVSREIEGHVLTAALEPAFRQAHPVRSVASYGNRPAQPRTRSDFDDAVLEELHSLGYIN